MARRRAGGIWTVDADHPCGDHCVVHWSLEHAKSCCAHGPAIAEPSTSSSIEMPPPGDETPTTTSPIAAVAYVTATTLNVRASPGKDAAKLGTLARGDRVTVTQVQDGWATLRLPSGATAWASAEFLSPSPPAPVVQPFKPTEAAVARPSRSAIIRDIIQESMQSYSGNCPCPENRDRAGRRCGGRSAWSRAGGARPICYAADVTEGMIERYLARD